MGYKVQKTKFSNLSKRCANLELKRSTVRRTAAQYVDTGFLGCIVCLFATVGLEGCVLSECCTVGCRFAGSMDRHEAANRMQHLPDNVFLVRLNPDELRYAVSLK